MLEVGSALHVLALVGACVGITGFSATSVSAQDYTSGAVTVNVLDQSGSPVSGATVTITSLDQGAERTSTSTSTGGFRFSLLAPGDYTIVVNAPGYDQITVESINVLGSQTRSLAINLTTTGNEIVVTGASIVAEFSGTTTGLNVDVAELVKTVPLARDLTSVVLLAPGTTGGGSAFGNLASIGGSSVAENAYYLNGLNLTNFDNYLGSARVPFEFYQSVEVKSGGYPAEFGRATGGIVNAVSKSGSNEYTAAAHLNWSPNFLRSQDRDLYRNTFGENGGNITNRALDRVESYSAIVELGMPIIEDKLFVYGLAEFREDESIVINRAAETATRSVQNDPFWAVKVDAFPIDGQHPEFTIFDTSRTSNVSEAAYFEGETGADYGSFAGIRDNNFGGVNFVGKYTGNFTDWLTLSAGYGRMRDRFDTDVFGSTLPRVANSSGQTVGGVSNGGFYNAQRSNRLTTPYRTEREFYRADADLYFSALGDHHVRFGFDKEINTLSRFSVGTGGDYLLANGLITQAAYDAGAGSAGFEYIIFPGATPAGAPNPGLVVDQIYFNSGGEFESTNRSFYIQDEWNITDRLTVNLGLRRDDFSVLKADRSTFFDLDENYAPRVGVDYTMWGDRSGRLYGFYGQYFLPVASNTAFRGAGVEFFFRERFAFNGFGPDGIPLTTGPQITGAVDSRYSLACPFALSPNGAGGNTCRVTGDGNLPGSTQFVAANLKATKQSEFIIGYEHSLGDWTVGINYTHRELNRTAEDASIDRAANIYCVDQGFSQADCENIWNGFHQYVTYNVGGPLTVDLLGGGSPGNPANVLDGQTVTFSAEDLGFPKATRRYDAVELTFNRPFDGKWSLGGSYTWSAAYGNTEGYVQSDFGQADAGITQDFDVIGFTDFATGFLPNHRRHRIKLFGAVALSDNFSIGANSRVDSPRPLSCFGFHPTDTVGNLYGAASRYCGLEPAPRGEGLKSDWIFNLDVSPRYRVELPTGQEITFRIDVFNLLNLHGIQERIETGDRDIADQNAAGQPTAVTPDIDYGLPSSFQAPRSVRLGLDITF